MTAAIDFVCLSFIVKDILYNDDFPYIYFITKFSNCIIN